MKKSALVLLLITLISVAKLHAQAPINDTINRRTVEQLQADMENMKLNLAKCHSRYAAGFSLQILSAIGAVVVASIGEPNLDGVTVGLAAMAGIGTVMMIDSHKFLGRASGIKPVKNE